MRRQFGGPQARPGRSPGPPSQPSAKRAKRTPAERRCVGPRPHPDPRLGDDAERPLRAEQQPVGRRAGARARAAAARPRRPAPGVIARTDSDDVVDVRRARGEVPAGARRDPAAERRELERLRVEAQREPVLGELLLEPRARSRRPGCGRRARRGRPRARGRARRGERDRAAVARARDRVDAADHARRRRRPGTHATRSASHHSRTRSTSRLVARRGRRSRAGAGRRRGSRARRRRRSGPARSARAVVGVGGAQLGQVGRRDRAAAAGQLDVLERDGRPRLRRAEAEVRAQARARPRASSAGAGLLVLEPPAPVLAAAPAAASGHRSARIRGYAGPRAARARNPRPRPVGARRTSAPAGARTPTSRRRQTTRRPTTRSPRCRTAARRPTTAWPRASAGYTTPATGLELELQPMRWCLRLVERATRSSSISVLCVVRDADGPLARGPARGLGRDAGPAAGRSARAARSRSARTRSRPSPASSRRSGPSRPSASRSRRSCACPTARRCSSGRPGCAEGAEVVRDPEHDAHAWWPAEIRRAGPTEADPALRRMARLLSA